MELVFENNKMELNLELSFDEAVRKHKEMWGAMQNSLGDNPTLAERAAFKAGWTAARRAAGEKRIMNNCYLVLSIISTSLKIIVSLFALFEYLRRRKRRPIVI